MDLKKYISSGILELYVYGSLSESESAEVTRMVEKYPEVREEVEEIEKALTALSAAAAPSDPAHLYLPIKEKLTGREIPITRKRKKTNWPAYLGWAASFLLLIGLFFFYNQNQELKNSLEIVQTEKEKMESQLAEARNDAEKTEELLNTLRDRSILKVPLQGQEIAPDAYATAYWDADENVTYIDAKDLPAPPRGMVYQVWSLKMDPLTPTSIGLLEDFEQDENKIFRLQNTDSSEGFGITLEPEGGSESPTLERLYTLGTVS